MNVENRIKADLLMWPYDGVWEELKKSSRLRSGRCGITQRQNAFRADCSSGQRDQRPE